MLQTRHRPRTLFPAILLSALAAASLLAEQPEVSRISDIDWPQFMAKQDMHFKQLPKNWKQAPHFGNGMVGSMLYQSGNTLQLQLFRADVQDHRDDSYGWPAYSRPRLQIGYFSLTPKGNLTACDWRKDLWNAELTGTITTTEGTIKIRHYTHADDMAIVTQLTPSDGEKDCAWTWHAQPAQSTRGGYPSDPQQIPGFAKQYGAHYANTLKVAKANPAGRQETRDGVHVWIQDLLAGGQYATAWAEKADKSTRTHIATIANSYPAATAAETAVTDIQRFLKKDATAWVDTHRDWWHSYYKRSFISIPDPKFEAQYWQTIYRFGAAGRTGRSYIDTPALWFQGGNWAYTTTDWNIQAALWGVGAANRIEQGGELLERFHARQSELIKAVRPVEWQNDSAYLPIEVAGDLIGNREQDMRYYNLVGNLPWIMNNFWSQYRFTMDDVMLREKIFPLLRRSINLYLHLLTEDKDGKLHLEPTYSPETGVSIDCNFDLALLKWGCHTLLKSCARLQIDDPLIPRWKDVITRTIDFPGNQASGFHLGSNRDYDGQHRHLSHLLMIYPLHLANVEQKDHQYAAIMQKSLDRAMAVRGLPAMVQTHAAPMAAHMGLGETAYKGLKLLSNDLYPNGMWFDPPCMESSLGLANIVQEMLLQSWGDPANDQAGPIRIFPACPQAWQDATFHDLRAEGAFLVSAERKGGKTQWVRIKSLAGEPCTIQPNFAGEIKLQSKRPLKFEKISPGIYIIDLEKDEEVVLTQA